MTQIDLEGRAALVTGASRGIGRSIALGIAQAGGAVAVHYQSKEEAAARVVAEIKAAGGDAFSHAANVQISSEVKGLVDACVTRWGGLDIIICNAGIWKGSMVEEMTENQWDEMIDVNLKGMYLVTHYAVPHLKSSTAGTIVNIASTAGQRGEAGHAHYAASKGGMLAWTKSLAPELAPFGVRVNCVAPGWVHTDMAAAVLKADGKTINAGIPLGRAGKPEEIAAVACFMASDLASYMTGEIVNVNGGSVLCG
ncbi:MAG: SDR family NAD(P)-dependent oxidoreductase [Acidobacteriota bacterium]|nr:SDR family NAD(P)-dependent oxidoreductase [Acidobacteriota bacterium]MEE3273532.1 SDR family NAD(P)-dependent oxidoreductase [Acidobacteriota bacterium]